MVFNGSAYGFENTHNKQSLKIDPGTIYFIWCNTMCYGAYHIQWSAINV